MARRPKALVVRGKFPYWLLACAILFGLFIILIIVDGGTRLIFYTLSYGIAITVLVSVVSFSLACLLGAIVALAIRSKLTFINQAATFYIEIIRGLPILVLLFYVVFVGAPQLVIAYNWIFAALIKLELMDRLLVRDFSLLWRAIFALTVSYSAFLAEVFRAGLQAIDRGIIEAGQSLGLSNWQVLRFIIAPQAVRIITPPLGNEFIAMVKDSALVSVLGVQDITQLGKLYSSSTFLFFPTYNMVTFIYLTITISLSLAVRYFEKKLNRFEQRS